MRLIREVGEEGEEGMEVREEGDEGVEVREEGEEGVEVREEGEEGVEVREEGEESMEVREEGDEGVEVREEGMEVREEGEEGVEVREEGEEGVEVGEEGYYVYLSLHCHQQNDSCIQMGSDESHFNISSIVRDKATRQCQQTTAFEEKGEPKRGPYAYQPNALPLDQTGLRLMVGSLDPQSPVARRFL